MKSILSIFVLCLTLLAGGQAFGVTAQEALEAIDSVRAPGPDFVFTVNAKLLEKPDSTDNVFEVMVRENTKSLVKYIQPVKQKGRVLLMDGPDMWIFIPGTSRSLRISPAQQLVGGVSHADVARVVFSLDYTANTAVVVNEKGEDLYKLGLSSKASNTPYRTINLYCTPDFEPVKAEFFSLSGKLLRTAYYENYQMVLGKMRPMSIRMISAVSSSENVQLNYSGMALKETPAVYYQPSYLGKIR